MNSKKTRISKFHRQNHQASREKSTSFADFWQNNSTYMHNQWQTLVYFKKISSKKIPICRYSLKYFRIYHVIQKSNVRICYIFAFLIVKRLEFKPISGNKHTFSLSTTQRKKNRIFQNFSCQKMATKAQFLLIFVKVIALKKAKIFKHFGYNLRKGARFVN